MSKPITFTTVAGAECRYARAPVAPYGTIGKGPRKQRLMPEAHAALTSALEELWSIHPWGRARYVVSAGAMVEQSDRRGPNDAHVRGLAYDLDAIWWVEPLFSLAQPLITLDAPKQWRHYIAVQCVLARWFGTVIGYDYSVVTKHRSGDHRNHWHVDICRPVGWSKSEKADVTLLQRGLNEVWGESLKVDGKYGPKTKEAWQNHTSLDLLGWRDWLLATAKRGLEEL